MARIQERREDFKEALVQSGSTRDADLYSKGVCAAFAELLSLKLSDLQQPEHVPTGVPEGAVP